MITLSILSQLELLANTHSSLPEAASDAVNPFVFRLSIFVLAVFVGYSSSGR